MGAKAYRLAAGGNIRRLREQMGLTREALAELTGVSPREVGKWEAARLLPGLPVLAALGKLFAVPPGSLLCADGEAEAVCAQRPLPFPDDGKLRAVLYRGGEILGVRDPDAGRVTFEYRGKARDIEAAMPLVCQNVRGSVTARDGVSCGDVGGGVSAGGDAQCKAVGGNVRVSGSLTCGDISGDVYAKGDIRCDVLEGEAKADGNITCRVAQGDVYARCNVICDVVEGDAEAYMLNCAEVRHQE